MSVLVTGAAGFIGFHTAQRLLEKGEEVVGVDNFNSFYDPALKETRAALLLANPSFTLHRADLNDPALLDTLSRQDGLTAIIHLAAHAGVRASMERPLDYVDTNLRAHVAMLELARNLSGVGRFLYASSSSVYGNSTAMPLSVTADVDHPISVYAATKRAAEIFTDTYAQAFGIKAIGYRFFNVYGPYGRPDMAYYAFARAIFEDRPLRFYGDGSMRRDWTWIDDVVDGLMAGLAMNNPAGFHRVYNLGNNYNTSLTDFVALLEQAIGKKAKIERHPVPTGDVHETRADISESAADLGFSPAVSVDQGLPQFIEWCRSFHGY